MRVPTGGQPVVDSDILNKCCLNITTIEAAIFQGNNPSIPFDNFKDHYVLVSDLTSIQEATEHCYYPELVGEPLRLELKLTSALENETKFSFLGYRMSSVAVETFVVVEKIF